MNVRPNHATKMLNVQTQMALTSALATLAMLETDRHALIRTSVLLKLMTVATTHNVSIQKAVSPVPVTMELGLIVHPHGF